MFEQGVVIISIDTERMWGHFDLRSEEGFERRYPKAIEAHEDLLNCLVEAEIPATWDVVGALSLASSEGPGDPRLRGLPSARTSLIPAGDEHSAPLWYAREFVRRIQQVKPAQEIGLHGGLIHLVWGDPRTTEEIAREELLAGVAALREIGIQPKSFVFPRDQEGHHALLPEGGIECYRGAAPILSERLGFNLVGSCVRVIEEIGELTPPAVWPEERLPGLWNIASSMPLYSMGQARSRVVPLSLRRKRTCLGVEEAARKKGIFHLEMHPENLAEGPDAVGMFASILEEISRRRGLGDIEVMTMSQALTRWKSETLEEVLV